MGSGEKLPCEVVEQVLAFLPVPDLCRYRSVCKRWTSLICSPDFGTRCIQNASNGVVKRECFVVKLRLCIDSAESGARCKEISSWSIFDRDTRRWYNVEDTLPKGFDFHVSAMDAGLVCTFRTALTEEQRRASTILSSITSERQILVVSGLIGKSVRVLPNPPLPVHLEEANLKLVVDKVSQAYKIFLISAGLSWRSPRDPCMCVYDSSTDQWQFSTNPPVDPINKPDRHVRSAVYEGVLYVLFADENRLVRGLYSYNEFADSWECTGVKFGQDFMVMIEYCDLVVSNNRLFLIYQSLMDETLAEQNSRPRVRPRLPNRSLYKPRWPLYISEVPLLEENCKTVAQMTQEEAIQRFDIQTPYDRSKFSTDFEIRANGFDNSILLMTKKVHGEGGKYILYNLVTGLWEVLPPNPVECLQFEDGHRGSLWRDGNYVTPYLRLPNAPW
jgi:hypothetical protein